MNGLIENRLEALKSSKFRAGITLRPAERAMWQEKGEVVIREHAYDLLRKRLAPAHPPKDGKQTPWRGHPVFVAQHATATCCRTCLMRWHNIPRGRALTEAELDYTVGVIAAWLERQVKTIDTQ